MRRPNYQPIGCGIDMLDRKHLAGKGIAFTNQDGEALIEDLSGC
jgi:hypothetical protein